MTDVASTDAFAAAALAGITRVVQDPARLAALRDTGLLDAPTEAAFDRLASLAARLLRAPLATVTLVDADRQFYTACVGLPEPLATARETPLDVSFCRLTVADAAAHPTVLRPLAIADTRLDPRTREMASVTEFGVHAYAGVALVVEGHPLGTLCVMDLVPRAWTAGELEVLVDLGAAATTEIELRVANRRLQASGDAAAAARDALALAYAQLQEQQTELEATTLLLAEEVAASDVARREAESANRSKADFLSTMSHELRTPLNAIAGYTELLAMGVRGPVNPEQALDLERVRRANQHLMALVTDILNFARLEAGQVEYQLADVELRTVVADVESLVRPQLDARSLAFSYDDCAVDTPDAPHVVRADPEKLRQVLVNLLTNAIKFTDAGGRVTLACRRDVGTVRLAVTDTGRGISPDHLDRIFEPFVQVDRHHMHVSQQGVGLGLAISRDLARGMGGELSVESTPGVGSTFTLTLPAT